MALFSLFRSRRPSASRKSAPVRLTVEALEERAVPAALTAAPVADLGAALVSHGAQDHGAQPLAPFKLKGEGAVVGVNPDGSLAMAWTGTATHLGRYSATGVMVLADNGIDFTITGTYTAANGDLLHFTSAGQLANPLGSVDANPGTGSAVITGGTGRFANVTGFAEFSGVINLDGTFQVRHDDGGLSF
jgi:hypothetical protein